MSFALRLSRNASFHSLHKAEIESLYIQLLSPYYFVIEIYYYCLYFGLAFGHARRRILYGTTVPKQLSF